MLLCVRCQEKKLIPWICCAFDNVLHLARPDLAEPKSGIGPSDCVRYHFKDDKKLLRYSKTYKFNKALRDKYSKIPPTLVTPVTLVILVIRQPGHTGHPCVPVRPGHPGRPNQFLSVSLFGDFFLLPPATAHPQ